MDSESWLAGARASLGQTSPGPPGSCTESCCFCKSLLGSRRDCPGNWLTCMVQAWHVTGHNLSALAQAHRQHLPSLLPTVFHFGPTNLMMLVDVRGLDPGEVRVEVLGSCIKLLITQQETLKGDNDTGTTASRNLERVYEFPQGLASEEAASSVREGTLFVSVPWSPPHPALTLFI